MFASLINIHTSIVNDDGPDVIYDDVIYDDVEVDIYCGGGHPSLLWRWIFIMVEVDIYNGGGGYL